MTTGRTRPILPEQPLGDKDGKEQQPASSARPRLFLAGAIKQLFQKAREVLTGKEAPPPEPVQRRRRSGEDTGKAFRMTAKKIVKRRMSRLPAEAYAAATVFLADTLDWLNLWHHDDSHEEDFQAAPSDHLYPHL